MGCGQGGCGTWIWSVKEKHHSLLYGVHYLYLRSRLASGGKQQRHSGSGELTGLRGVGGSGLDGTGAGGLDGKGGKECIGMWYLGFRPMEGTIQTYVVDTGNGNNTSMGKADERGGKPMAARAALATAGVVMVEVKGGERD